MGEVIYGVDFRKHLDREDELVRMANVIFAEAFPIEDTAPCEMPPSVQPGFYAPESDPA